MITTGHNLADEVKGRFLVPLLMYRQVAFRDVVPVFADLERKANKVADDYFQDAVNAPAGEDAGGDLSGFAEHAEDEGLSYFETMTSIRQTMLNLLAAGLFHLLEQQLASICRECSSANALFEGTKLRSIDSWMEKHLRVQLKILVSYSRLNEMRLLANTVKHAEVGETAELRKLRPELFRDPRILERARYIGDDGEAELMVREAIVQRVSQPLAGEDLFVTEAILQSYTSAAEELFQEIAAQLAIQGDDALPV